MSEKISTTNSQAFEIAENKVVTWLVKRNFHSIKFGYHRTKLWDITAKKGNENWIITVETGTNLRSKIDSIQKILYKKVGRTGGYHRFGLAFVIKLKVYWKVYFFEYRKLV